MGQNYKKEFVRLFYYVVILIIIFSCVVLFILNNKKEITSNYDSINFKLITSTHTNIPRDFKAVNSSIEIKIGEVTNIKYIVKNLSDKKTSGVATFAYYPKELNLYISKIECFCYDIKALNAGEEVTYTLTMMIDPRVTKDNKTKSIKEAIIQFTFFDSKSYKEKKS